MSETMEINKKQFINITFLCMFAVVLLLHNLQYPCYLHYFKRIWHTLLEVESSRYYVFIT